MLSYRHAFHAGSFADILKHLVLANTLDHVIRKPAPVLYIDTHAGAACYSLHSAMARKTREADKGILALTFAALARQLDPEARAGLDSYQKALLPFLGRHHYPGSPALAAALLRPQDRLHLYELHNTDFNHLNDYFAQEHRTVCEKADGFLSARALLPPVHKRAVVLLDPSYEIKDDYKKVVAYLSTASQRMRDIHLLLWYPVVQRQDCDKMIARIMRAGLRDLWQFELGMTPDTSDFGMSASGIIAVNPPWTLPGRLRQILPALQQQLAPLQGNWKVECLVPE
ncbi:MAG: 23S rRNA (adenine(2030)-N(6))-methyltransferase RlmJ [Pseudomonadales bacterium]|nr:23S rRNA (adenine(2030)-N(6))-methyltransferase RlmJ [Pseudomonadales bacterium]